MIEREKRAKEGRRPSNASVTIAAEQQQFGDFLSVSYRIKAPAKSDLYFYCGPPEYIIEGDQEPGICVAPDDSIPLLRFYLAQLGLVPGLRINAFETPPIKCIEAGHEYKGTFPVPSAIARTDVGAGGEARPVSIPLPPRFRVQMTVGYSLKEFKPDPGATNPIARLLDWQMSLDSNVLFVRRKFCWEVGEQ